MLLYTFWAHGFSSQIPEVKFTKLRSFCLFYIFNGFCLVQRMIDVLSNFPLLICFGNMDFAMERPKSQDQVS